MKRKIISVIIAITMVILLVGCGEKSTYQPGSWPSEDSYTSNWMGLIYKLPDNVQKVTSDHTWGRRYLYSGVFYGDKDEPTVNDLEEVVTIEMCGYYLDENSYIWITSEEIPDESLTLDDFIDEYMEIISSPIADIQVLEEKESVTVAGTDYRFIKYKYSGMGINQYHYMYFTQQENRVNYILIEAVGNDGEKSVPYLLSGFSEF